MAKSNKPTSAGAPSKSAGQKTKPKASKIKAAPPPPSSPPPAALGDDKDNDEEDEEESDSEDDGVDEQGMKRLMDALGDDGLDEFASAQLEGLDVSDKNEDGGEEEWSDIEDEEAAKASDGSDSEDGNDEDDEEESEAGDMQDDEELGDVVALDDVSDVDEDAVPRQKIVINNKVRSRLLCFIHSRISFILLFICAKGCLAKNTRNDQTRPIINLDRYPLYDISRTSCC